MTLTADMAISVWPAVTRIVPAAFNRQLLALGAMVMLESSTLPMPARSAVPNGC
jgi:hypothetical protein